MAYPFVGVNLIRNIENVKRQRFVADDPFEFSDFKFIKLYRIRKHDFENLEQMLQPFLPVRQRSHSIDKPKPLHNDKELVNPDNNLSDAVLVEDRQIGMVKTFQITF